VLVGVSAGVSLGVPVGVGVGVSVSVGVLVGVSAGVSLGVPVGVSVGVLVGVSLGVSAGVSAGVPVGVGVTPILSIVITNELAVPPDPQLQVYVPGVKFIPVIVVPAYVVEPLINEPEVYPVGTNKFLFDTFGNIPKVSPKPDRVPRDPPSIPKLIGNVVITPYISRVGPGDVTLPIPQIACDDWNPAVSS
jgi:hypothetical protein